ncbi:hypothetical protein DB346_15540 [Verrucomicrobia bacterium LW23]|nr:hypothetical protein DB346_15540 [Verrucomicrobia bacterium LW23]
MSRILTILLYLVSTYLIAIIFMMMLASSNARGVAASLNKERRELEAMQREAIVSQQNRQAKVSVLQTLSAQIAASPSLRHLLGKYGVQIRAGTQPAAQEPASR